MAAAESQHLQCMEVWGGNQPVDSGVIMAGLDAWVYSKPHGGSSAGGDVHYVSSCATGRINRLLVADVSGHGDRVAQTAIMLRSLMRRYVNFIDQTRFVTSLNQQFAAMARSGLFATAVATTFFAPTRELTLCNAGHPAPLIFRARTRTWDYIALGDDTPTSPTDMPLGILDATDYRLFRTTLQVGDLVLCYTDSLTESHASSGRLLGEEGLLNIIRGIPTDPANEIIPALLAAIGKLHPVNLTEDDVTILLFRPNGLGEQPPFTTRLLAPLRLLGEAVRSLLKPGVGPAPWPEMSAVNLGFAKPAKPNDS